MIRGFMLAIWALVQPIRWLIVALLGIGLPAFLYLTFIADEPVFGEELDVELGLRAVEAIEADPGQFPILSRDAHPDVYAHVQSIVDRLLASPEIRRRDLFAYGEVRIIDAEVLNAFCTPGGFIYVYSGLIRYLDAEDHLAGVLGHEIAHAELRHSSTRLQREFGAKRLAEFAVLSQPITAGNVVGAEIARELLTLSYSREQEAEADALSVMYLSSSGYACDGAAGFFEKLLREGDDAGVLALLSDHPDSASRVRDIRHEASRLACSTELANPASWRLLQERLVGSEALGETDSGTNPDQERGSP